MAHNIINSNDVKNICSQIQLSNLIENNLRKTFVTIYISNIFKDENEEDDEIWKYIQKNIKKVLKLIKKEFQMK